MHRKKMKKFVSILLILGLVFTSGAFSFAYNYDEFELELFEVEEELVIDGDDLVVGDDLFIGGDPGVDEELEATFGPVSLDDNFVIKFVEVRDGGEVQARYRDARRFDVSRFTVYSGADPELAVNGEDPDLWYTTARNASLLDRRNFTVELLIPRGDYTGIGTGPGQFNPLDVTFTYTADTWNPIQSVTGRTARILGGYIFVEATLVFGSSVANPITSGMQLPYTPYYNKTNPNATDWARTGVWPLRAIYDGDVVGELELRMAINDTHKHPNESDAFSEEFVAKWPDGTTEYGDFGRYMKVESFGESRRGNQIWSVIIADSKESVDNHVNVTVPLLNSNPEALKAQIAQPGDNTKQVVVWSAVHGNESLSNGINYELVNRLLFYEYLRYTASPEHLTFNTLPTTSTTTGGAGVTMRHDRWGGYEEFVLDIDAFLDKYIVIITTNNTDGNRTPVRANYYTPADTNRDGGHWAFPETRRSVAMFAKYNPTFLGEWHGYVGNFLVCALTPPANPAIEVDQQLMNQFRLAEAFCQGGLGLSPYDRFNIPYRDMPSGWDNGAVLYTPAKGTMFGTMGLTIELARSGQDDIDVGIQAAFALKDYLLEHRDHFFNALITQKIRGVNNIDEKELLSPWFTTVSPFIRDRLHLMNQTIQNWMAANTGYIERPRLIRDGVELSFFPDYYILPVDPALQYSPAGAIEALTMLQDFAGARIEISTEPVTYEGVTYPAGTYLIDLRQGNRTVVNTLLYPGYDASTAPSLYDAQTTVSWPGQKGFNSIRAWAPDLFAGKSVPVNVAREFLIEGDGEFVAFKNSGRDPIRLVSRLLYSGIDVYIVTGYVPGAAIGDFVAKRADVIAMSAVMDDPIPRGANINPGFGGYPSPGGTLWGPQQLSIFGVDLGNALPANVTQLVTPRINIAAPSGQDAYMWDALGFPGSWFEAGATGDRAVHVGAAASANADIPAVVWNATAAIANNANMLGAGAVTAQSATGHAEMLGRATWSSSSLVAANYGLFDQLMAYNNAKFTNPRDDLKVLAAFNEGTGSEIYLAGRKGEINAHEYSGLIVALSGVRANGTGVTVINENPHTRARYWAIYNLIGTSVLAYAAGIADVPRPVVTADIPSSGDILGNIDVTLDILAEDTAGVDATVAVQKYIVNSAPLGPVYDAADSAWKDIPANGVVSVGIGQYIHWYVENSKGVNSQGSFGPYSSEKPPVFARVSAKDRQHLNDPIEYTISLREFKDIVGIRVNFEVDSSILAGNTAIGLAGFDVVSLGDPIRWTYLGDDIWQGSVDLLQLGGGTLTSVEPVDVATLIFGANAIGAAAVTITGVEVTGVYNGTMVNFPVIIEPGDTSIIVNIYDVDRSGIVNFIDMSIVAVYYGRFDTDPDWLTVTLLNNVRGEPIFTRDVDVNNDGRVSILDIGDVFINFD